MQNHKEMLQNAENNQHSPTLSPKAALLSSRAALNLISHQDSSPVNFPTLSITMLGCICTLMDGSVFGEIKLGDGNGDRWIALLGKTHVFSCVWDFSLFQS